MTTDYSTVTEMPGNQITQHALQMIRSRYAVAREHCEDKEVLEVGCGTGYGLGHMARSARRVTGGDYTDSMLRLAQNHYRERVGIMRLDAHSLPFKSDSFDTVILFEALYYLQDPDRFLEECRRVIGKKGTLVVCTVNKDCPDFNSSPFSTRYFSAPELYSLLARHGFETQLFGAFAATSNSLSGKAVSLIKRGAVSLRLVPKRMKGKEWLKRIFYGKLINFTAELEETDEPEAPLEPIPNDVPTSDYRVMYAIGHTS